MPDNAITSLWKRFFREGLNPEEKERLARWIEESGQDEEMSVLLEQSWNEFSPDDSIGKEKAESMLAGILTRAKDLESKRGPVVSMKTKWRTRVAVAASVLLLAGAGSYWLFFSGRKAATATVAKKAPQDIKAPAANRAMLTLSNGQRVYLDSAGNGSMAMQADVKIVKLADGRIAYSGFTKEMIYNTLTNPRGSKAIDMTLSDGTRVWLNAGSSITYPVAFVGKERKLQMTGEAYFEVAHNASMPFRVQKGNTEVEVLGTHFNMNTYEDDGSLKITLLEGSIRVSASSNAAPQTLTPGQQAQIGAGRITVDKAADIEAVMAWKNGRFVFNGVHIQSVMRELSRWYDVDIVYNKEVKETFFAKIDRSTNMSNVFKILETTGGVHFEIEGKKIIVNP